MARFKVRPARSGGPVTYRGEQPWQVELLRRALPQMRLLTYQMPDELLAIASAGEFDEFDLNEFFEASGTGAKAQFKNTRATCPNTIGTK
jgi:hypothetical protein